MAHMKHLIEQKLPGVYVRALEITTYDGSIFTGIDLQVSPWGFWPTPLTGRLAHV
jgi:hypothetical protein